MLDLKKIKEDNPDNDTIQNLCKFCDTLLEDNAKLALIIKTFGEDGNWTKEWSFKNSKYQAVFNHGHSLIGKELVNYIIKQYGLEP